MDRGPVLIVAVLVLVAGLALIPVAWAGPATSSPMVDVRGQLVPVGDRPLGPHRVSVQSSRDSASTLTTDGSFALRVSSTDEVLRIQIDAAPGADRRFHPALFRASVEELQAGITVLMIPFEWTVQRGRYAGKTARISMHEAFYAPEMALPPYLDGEIRDELYRAAPARWDAADRPVPVPIRNAAPDARTLEATDSARVWEAINETEEVFGRDLFRPAPGEYGDWEDVEQPPDGALGVVIDTAGGAHECTGGGYRRGETVWEQPPTLAKVWQEPPPAGYTADAVRIRSALNIYCHHVFEDRSHEAVISALQHELLHALGFGHGCTIPSHMAYRCEPQTDGIRTFSISPYDVAYWELREAVFDGAEAHETRFAFLPALFGERALVRGRRPIPSPRDWETRTLPIPPVPDTLAARVENVWSGSPQVRLDWPGEVSIDSRSYKVYRDTRPIAGDPAAIAPLDTLAAWSVSGGSTYHDASVREGNVYFYRVSAFYADHPKESPFSGQVRVVIPRVMSDSVTPSRAATFDGAGVTVRTADAAGTVQLAVYDGTAGPTSAAPDRRRRLPYGIALRADSSLIDRRAEIRVQRAALGDREGATAVRAVRQSPTDPEAVDPLTTSYDSEDDALEFVSAPHGEFVFTRRDDPPVELSSFDAQTRNGQVILRWATVSGRHGAGFEVQRRSDGRERWKVIGVAEGDSTASDQTYYYADSEPMEEADSIRYRLRLLRADGAASLAYSNVVVVDAPASREASTSEDGDSSTGSDGGPEAARSGIRPADLGYR